jgi:hypothetical protein
MKAAARVFGPDGVRQNYHRHENVAKCPNRSACAKHPAAMRPEQANSAHGTGGRLQHRRRRNHLLNRGLVLSTSLPRTETEPF